MPQLVNRGLKSVVDISWPCAEKHPRICNRLNVLRLRQFFEGWGLPLPAV